MKSAVPHVDRGQLLDSMGLSGWPEAILNRMLRLPGVRQQGGLDHAAAVAAHLRGLGLEQQQLAGLLDLCAVLFSWPPEQRAAVLFSQLMRADGGSGLTAAGAVHCFAAYYQAAHTASFATGIAALAAILIHGQNSSRGRQAAVRAEAWTVAGLLRRIPRAVRLLCMKPGQLQRRSDELLQAGFTPADVAWIAWHRPDLLARNSAKHVQLVVEVLQQELGLEAQQALGLAKQTPSWLDSSIGTLRERIQALCEVRCQQGTGCSPLISWQLQQNSQCHPSTSVAAHQS